MPGSQQPLTPARPSRLWLRWALVIACLAGAIWLVLQGLEWLHGLIMDYADMQGPLPVSSMLVMMVVLYAVLIAIPFMPGIEVGVALLVLQGAAIAPFVYLATVTGLMAAFLIGHLVPLPWLHRFFGALGLKRICALIDAIAIHTPAQRLVKQRAFLPPVLAKLTVEYRYATLGVLLNVPGTFAIGGGGGILLTAGLSRVFRPWAVLLTLLIATLPVPLAVWVLGTQILP